MAKPIEGAAKKVNVDGPFWIVWMWVIVPIAAALSWWKWGVADIRWGWVAASFYAMVTGVSLAFHRYFSHRSFKTSRWFQFVLALLGTYSGQTGALSWELLHDEHHKNCEVEGDPHSIHRGFWYAHGFFLLYENPRRDPSRSKWAKYPELVMLEKIAPIFYYACGIAIGYFTGLKGAIWYWGVPTLLAWNATMIINSFGHGYGSFDYKDLHRPDDCVATNVWWAWPFILGDNWHNNHHAYPNAAAHGWEWWQIDPNWYLIWLMEKVGLIWDPIKPSPTVLRKNKVRGPEDIPSRHRPRPG